MGDRRLVFLDFDGVICDSLPECFTASRTAYHELFPGGGGAAGASTSPAAAEKQFAAVRPFIRRGGDYLFLHKAADDGVKLGSQEDFDRFVRENENLDDLFHDLFYQARDALFRRDPDLWYSLNPLYPGMGELLREAAEHPGNLILSTKAVEYILQILRFHGIEWKENRVYCSGKEPKLRFIDTIMGEAGASRGVFIDDQVDHFAGAGEYPVECLLADWGYVVPEWLSRAGVRTISLEDIRGVLFT